MAPLDFAMVETPTAPLPSKNDHFDDVQRLSKLFAVVLHGDQTKKFVRHRTLSW